jgi:hypothetical protein
VTNDETGDIGPFDFLFCKACNKHVGMNFALKNYSADIDKSKITDQDRQNRVAPVVNVKATPFCIECNGPLIQKWISVIVNIESI